MSQHQTPNAADPKYLRAKRIFGYGVETGLIRAGMYLAQLSDGHGKITPVAGDRNEVIIYLYSHETELDILDEACDKKLREKLGSHLGLPLPTS